MNKNILFLFLFSCFFLEIYAQKLVSKPFVGHKSQHQINAWCLFKNIDTVWFSVEDEQQQIVQQQTFVFEKKTAFRKYLPIVLNFDDLLPNTKYTIKYTINNETHELLRTKTENNETENFSFLTGSCAFVGTSINRLVKPFNNLKIFQSMQQDTAQMMLWLGDNIYYIFEQNSHKKQLKRNTQVRLNKKMNRFLNSKEQYAIWDDHDYGSNNSGEEFKNKHSSLNIFQQFWVNPKNETLNYYTFPKEDIQFFMLDDRFYKNDTVVLGKAQLSWLKQELLKSKAVFKIIGIGTQALNKSGVHESFYNAKAEFDELMQFINDHKINGIFFLTGDRHFAELVKMDDIIGYPLYDFTTSPISMYPLKKKSSEALINPSVSGTYYNRNNYGKITVEGNPVNRQCILELKNRKGEVVWKYIIDAKELVFQE